MGLDSVITLRNRKMPELDLEFGYFRKYFELDDWVRGCKHVENSKEDIGYFECEFTPKAVEELMKEIRPIYDIMCKYDESELSYYEDGEEEYPRKLVKQLYGKGIFNPTESNSFFLGIS